MDDERSSRSAAIRAGMAAAKAQGRVPTGRPSKLPAATRERIVRERAAGRSLREIAAGLNRDQVPTGQGGATWWASTVRYVLRGQQRAPSRAPRPSR